jgi:hypothetical protein
VGAEKRCEEKPDDCSKDTFGTMGREEITMADNDALHTAKCDGPALFAILGDGPGTIKCPIHDDHSPSMSVQQAENGTWVYNCHACGAAGTVVDAYAWKHGCTPADAIKAILGSTGQSAAPTKPHPPNGTASTHPARAKIVGVAPPVPDRNRLDKLIAASVAHLAAHPELLGPGTKRGLTADVCSRFQVGHLPALTFREWGSKQIHDVWTMPVLSPDGKNYVAVKLHSDNPGRAPKCGWAPFGTEPFEKPRHGMNTWFPNPLELAAPSLAERAVIHGPDVPAHAIRPAHPWETLPDDPDRPWYICPGELKALAVCSAEPPWPAISLTGGESAKMTKDLSAPLAGKNIVLLYDDDPAGHKWRDRLNEELAFIAKSIDSQTLGHKGQTQ